MKLLIIRKTINPKDTVNNKFFNELSRNMVWYHLLYKKVNF
jgi:hypothetical protein